MAKRFQDSTGAGMINSNFSARANLPQEVIMKDYPSEGMALPAGYPSYGINVVDTQMSKDSSKIKSIMDPRKI